MTTTLTGLKIWNGIETIGADTILIDRGTIVDIGGPAKGRAIDCSGLTAMPGLTDAHVHLELNPDDKDAPAQTRETVVPQMAERAAKMVKAGITTARDLGGGAWYELALRDAIAAGKALGPRLLCSGQPLTSPHGHCHFWGGAAASLDEAKSVLTRQLDHGVDLIKIMATGGRLTKGSEPTDLQFSQADLVALVEMAHGAHKHVAAHCHGTEGIQRAARAGVNTIEHCSWVGQEGWASDFQADIAELILANGCWVSPTVNKGFGERMLASKTGNILGRVRQAYRHMIDIGIPMVASTDAGIPGVFHEDLPHALLFFAEIAELSPAATLRCATSDAARALGISDQTGTLAVGMAADILVVDGDPTRDLPAVTRPVHVFARGRAALEN